ncbi:MAG TPA: response regulator [Thermodesulfobacteriota bacterium]|nr:response regulator [Thermodesulfobacteriota bacterium]
MGGERVFKVLIADDDENLRELLTESVRDWGYKTEIAMDGREALKKFQAGNFDIVICDIKMPGLDGLKLIEKLKEHDKDILVIVITGYASLESAIKAIEAGAYDYLAKPFRLDELMVIMKNASELLCLAARNRELREELNKAYGELDSLKSTLSRGGVAPQSENEE